mmetsp:Transcript_81116/g.169392  ORF Transcript_81116/g.169392 Transcript_81116/m.169392 type:complete len:87 (+) Transcript_81116:40-300(+)
MWRAEMAAALSTGFLSSNSASLEPQQAAHSLSLVEEEWRQEALYFSSCSAGTIPQDRPCGEASTAFGKSCDTIVSAVVKVRPHREC